MVAATVTQIIVTVDLTSVAEQETALTLTTSGVALDVQLIQKTETEAKYLVSVLDSA